MFTGIIEKLAPITQLDHSKGLTPVNSDELRFVVQTGYKDLDMGESIAINGVCLTVSEILPEVGQAVFYLSAETLARTNLKEVKVHSSVNLERAMRVNARLSGHIVQGHVDGVGKLLKSQADGEGHLLEFEIPGSLSNYIVEKGSICLNGVSLTVNRLETEKTRSIVHITLIPHTWENTNFRELKPGALINVEVDVLAKYVEKLCHPYLASKAH
jgi:riboflavin synthase